MTTLDNIIEICKEYITDSDCVYKMCRNEYLVVMKETPATITNEQRKNIFDVDYAKCRASEFMVMTIINIFDLSNKPKMLLHQFNGHKIQYTVGEKAAPDRFDMNYENVCAGGIHYFKKIECAYFYRTRCPNYIGYWDSWDDNGEMIHRKLSVQKNIVETFCPSQDVIVDLNNNCIVVRGIWTTYHFNENRKTGGALQ